MQMTSELVIKNILAAELLPNEQTNQPVILEKQQRKSGDFDKLPV